MIYCTLVNKTHSHLHQFSDNLKVLTINMQKFIPHGTAA